jgi:hypothetical protein
MMRIIVVFSAMYTVLELNGDIPILRHHMDVVDTVPAAKGQALPPTKPMDVRCKCFWIGICATTYKATW